MHRLRYENMTPQWSILNNGLWRKVENEIQTKLLNKPANERVMVVTGTFGFCELFNNTQIAYEIFLAVNNKIPVPKHIWKLYFNKRNPDDSIVYIIINNPYITITENTYMCKNICIDKFEDNDEGNRLTFRISGESNGLNTVYCCSVHDFLFAYGYLEDIVLDVFQ